MRELRGCPVFTFQPQAGDDTDPLTVTRLVSLWHVRIAHIGPEALDMVAASTATYKLDTPGSIAIHRQKLAVREL